MATTMIGADELKVLRTLVEAVISELDMDAVSPRLGEAVNAAEQLIDKATLFEREQAFGDQSKW